MPQFAAVSESERMYDFALEKISSEIQTENVTRTSLKFGNRGIYSHAICSSACSFDENVLFLEYLQIGPSITGYAVHADYSKIVLRVYLLGQSALQYKITTIVQVLSMRKF